VGKKPIALMTCAHVGLLELAVNFRNPVMRSIYKAREVRRAHYLESVERIVSYGSFFEKIYLVECVGGRLPRYLANSPGCLHGVSRNSLDCSNKGIQEFVNIANFLEKTTLDDEDLVLKITGRYLLNRADFLEFCRTSPADAVVKRDSDIWGEKGKGVHTFLFAARKRVIVGFSKWLLEGERFRAFGTIPVEWFFYDYLVNSAWDITLYPDKLHVTARYAPPLTAFEA
jgi:hypothetical protein